VAIEDIIAGIRDRIARIQDIEFDDLERKDLDRHAFTPYLNTFQIVIICINRLSLKILDVLPEGLLLQLHGLLERASDALQGVIRLRSTESNWESSQRSLVSQIEWLRDHFFQQFSPFLAFSTVLDLEPLKIQVDKVLGDFSEKSEKALATAQGTADEATRVLAAAKDALVKKSIANHAQQFSTEAKTHNKRAGYALVAALILGAGVVGYGFWLLRNPIPVGMDQLADLDRSGSLLQLVVGKLVIASVIITATLAALRIYRSHRHNAVVNTHRANALSAYEAFVAGTDDQGVRNSVLVLVTRSIFSPQPTGFLSHEPDPAPGTQVFELFRGMNDSTRPS
jgi:hypothetical protein